MFDRFTEPSRRALARARKEAQRLNQDFITTAHTLLGLIDACSGEILPLMDTALADKKATLEGLRAQVPQGRGTTSLGRLPFTPAARQALECTTEAVRVLRDRDIEPSHLLLALTLETHGRAAALLRERGATVETIGRRLLETRAIPLQEREEMVRSLLEIAARCRPQDDDAPPPGWSPERQLVGCLRPILLFACMLAGAAAAGAALTSILRVMRAMP